MASPSWEKQVPGAAGGRLQGFSMGGGEIARYFGKYGSNAASKAVIIRGVPPFLLKTADNPEGVDGNVFEGIKKAVARRVGTWRRGLRRRRAWPASQPGTKTSAKI